jgi:hypothetical protein
VVPTKRIPVGSAGLDVVGGHVAVVEAEQLEQLGGADAGAVTAAGHVCMCVKRGWEYAAQNSDEMRGVATAVEQATSTHRRYVMIGMTVVYHTVMLS